jgi:peptide/nickel transport system substrate-binding protein
VHLNPQFATGTKEQEGSRIFYEPLAGWDAEGNLVPVLAAEIPSARQRRPVGRRPHGDLEAQAGRHLARRPALQRRRRGLQLGVHQGPGHQHRRWISTYKDIKVEKVDSHTVRVTFPKPTPFWAEPSSARPA